MSITPEELDEIERILAARAEHNSITIAELDRIVALAPKLVAELRRPQALVPPTPTIDLAAPVEELGLSRRALRGVLASKAWTVKALTERRSLDLVMIRGFGPACLREVKEALAAHGLSLAGGAS